MPWFLAGLVHIPSPVSSAAVAVRHVPCGNFRKDVVGLSLKTPTVSHADNRCLYVGLSPSRLLLWAGECGTCVNTAVHSLLSLHIVAPRRTCLKALPRPPCRDRGPPVEFSEWPPLLSVCSGQRRTGRSPLSLPRGPPGAMRGTSMATGSFLLPL